MKKISAPLLPLLLLPLIAFAACERDTTYDEFAACLTDAGATYYGAYWCSNCQKQSELFGDSKDLLNYIECDEKGKDAQPQACLLEGIKGYPTWTFTDGSRLEGLQTLEVLSDKTNCPLPGEERSVMFE